MAQLKINGTNVDGFVKMGDGFLNALREPLPMKDYIVNKSRLTNGAIYTGTPKIDERDVTLTFVVYGATKAALATNISALYSMFYAGDISIKVNDEATTYYLKYLGKNVQYAETLTTCKITARFAEPDPTDR